MATISAKHGNNICQQQKWQQHQPQIGTQLVPPTNKTMAITSAKHGNNICQHQKWQ